MTDVRRLALDGIARIADENGYSQLVLSQLIESHPELTEQDRKLLTRLIYETVLHIGIIDQVITDHASMSLRAMKPEVRNGLRLGVCQLLFLGGIRPYAAVSTSVEAVKKTKARGLAGYVNGVLRAIDRDIKAGKLQPEKKVRLPEWLRERIVRERGEAAAEDLERVFGTDRPVCVRIDAQGEEREEVLAFLREKTTVRQGDIIPDAWYLGSAMDIRNWPCFQQGQISVQDESSMVPGEVLLKALRQHASETGSLRILDMCAAPGGKSAYMAVRLGRDPQLHGTVLSRDIHPSRVKLMEEYKERLGLSNMTCEVRDALDMRGEDIEAFDGVLLDAPCSGIGIVRSKPDILLKRTEEEIEELIDLQRRMLEAACRLVKKGGYLVYSTCTILDEENGSQAEAFALAHPEYEQVDLKDLLREDAGIYDRHLTLWPVADGHDGFFTAMFRRT